MVGQFNYQELRRLIETHFDLEGLKGLCFDLELTYDELAGDRLSSKTISLVEHVRKRGHMSHLMMALAQARPLIEWPQWESDGGSKVADSQPALLSSHPNNPFGRRGQIQDAADYLIRQPLTGALFNELQKGVSLSIIGPSQTGKSSLLWHITQQGPAVMGLPEEDFIYLSLELIHSEADFFDFICYQLGIETARGFRLARQLKNRKIVLCLDEIEKMTWDGFSLNVRTELRGLADGAGAPFVLVIASRSPLDHLFPDSPEMTSPLAGLCMQIRMPLFTLAEAQALVDSYLKDSDVVLPVEMVEEAWETTEGHPRNLQLALRAAFDKVLAGEQSDG